MGGCRRIVYFAVSGKMKGSLRRTDNAGKHPIGELDFI